MTTASWYLVHTKPRQESVAYVNLSRQGYECYMPEMRVERVLRGKTTVAAEPMFTRYLFIRLDGTSQGKSWSPIRSTLGVSCLVQFGSRAARVDDALVERLRYREAGMPTANLFNQGDKVWVTSGAFRGIEAIFQATDGASRAMILLDMLSRPVAMQVDVACLRKVG